jgi:hypothetical protein
VHEEFLHEYINLDLILILHLAQVQHIPMPDHLVLVVRKRVEEVRFVLSKGRVLNLKLN